jgi:hypothetical protein
MRYHAVMLDECGSEFPAEVEARDIYNAQTKLQDLYQESRVLDLCTVEERRAQRQALWAEVERELYDDEGY